MGLLENAHDVAQGASNSVASTVFGPVDGIAWLLRKVGLPIPPAPPGGSDWMRQAGLVQDPKSKNARMVGETLGLLAGPLTAAKAPQLARGLLQAGDELGSVALTGSSPGYASPFHQLGAMSPDGKARLLKDLQAKQSSGTYRLGDVTPGQGNRLDALFGRPQSGRDVLMTDEALNHLVDARLLRDNFTPEEVVRFAEQAMAKRSNAEANVAKSAQHPSLLNESLRDPATGRIYAARLPLKAVEGGYQVRSVVPEGLAPRNKKPPWNEP